jgi:hypothetical protein
MIRSDNAVQFSKTTALLGAAGKTTIRLLLRQAPSPNFSNSVMLLRQANLSPHNKRAAQSLTQAARRRVLSYFAYPRILILSVVLSMSVRFIVRKVV